MMGPVEALHKAIRDRLVADESVVEIIGARVFDRVPADVEFPYANFGEFQRLDDSADCIDGSEIYVTFHAWSRAYGSVEAKRLAATIVAALGTGAALDLSPSHRLVEFATDSDRILEDPDGVTMHAVLTFRALTEPA